MNKKLLISLYVYLFLVVVIFQYSGRDSLIENFYTEVALQRLDTRICNLLKVLPHYYNYERCYAFVARAIPEASICAKLSTEGEYRDMCYRDVAYATKNTRFCDEVSVPENKAYCYGDIGVVNTDATVCEKLPLELQRHCLEEYNLGTGAR